MADQQFLASFGVDIDESGVSRLQTILTENKTPAESLPSAFDAASESVRAFREQVATDLPTLFSGSGYGNVTENLFGSTGGLKIGLNMTELKKEIASPNRIALGTLTIVDNVSGFKTVCTGVSLQKVPDRTFDRTGTNLTYTLLATTITEQ